MSGGYIIDVSALIQAYVREPQTDNVLALLDGLPEDIGLHVPEFCLIECTNILWKHVRFQGMPVKAAQQALKDLGDLPLTIHPVSDYLSDSLTIGLDHELAIYDSLYIALAMGLQFPLITADSKQEQAARKAGVAIKAIMDFVPSE
jgi:predicted nucleic acid-binding protein